MGTKGGGEAFVIACCLDGGLFMIAETIFIGALGGDAA